MTIDELLSKHSDNYRFHGVRAATLSELIAQSENGEILLWGTDHDEIIDQIAFSLQDILDENF